MMFTGRHDIKVAWQQGVSGNYGTLLIQMVEQVVKENYTGAAGSLYSREN